MIESDGAVRIDGIAMRHFLEYMPIPIILYLMFQNTQTLHQYAQPSF